MWFQARSLPRQPRFDSCLKKPQKKKNRPKKVCLKWARHARRIIKIVKNTHINDRKMWTLDHRFGDRSYLKAFWDAALSHFNMITLHPKKLFWHGIWGLSIIMMKCGVLHLHKLWQSICGHRISHFMSLQLIQFHSQAQWNLCYSFQRNSHVYKNLSNLLMYFTIVVQPEMLHKVRRAKRAPQKCLGFYYLAHSLTIEFTLSCHMVNHYWSWDPL